MNKSLNFRTFVTVVCLPARGPSSASMTHVRAFGTLLGTERSSDLPASAVGANTGSPAHPFGCTCYADGSDGGAEVRPIRPEGRFSAAARAAIMRSRAAASLECAGDGYSEYLAKTANRRMHALNGNRNPKGVKASKKKVRMKTGSRKKSHKKETVVTIRTAGRKGQPRTRRITGHGDYAEDIGGKVGSFLAGKAWGWLKRLVGAGDYAEIDAKSAGEGINSNSLITSSSVPEFASIGEGKFRFTFHEYIGSIDATTAWTPNGYLIDVSSRATFPYLAQIATQFQEWQLIGGCFVYVSSSGYSTTAGAMGTVSGKVTYDVGEPAPPNKSAMVNSMFSSSGRYCDHQIFPIECSRGQTQFPVLKVRRAGVDVIDPQLYAAGRFFIATEGAATPYPKAGDLYITYDILLQKPAVDAYGGAYCFIMDLATNDPARILKPKDDTVAVKQPRFDNIGITRAANGLNLSFPLSIQTGSVWRVSVATWGDATANLGYILPLAGTGGMNSVQVDFNQSSTFSNFPSVGTNTGLYGMFCECFYRYDGSGTANVPPAVGFSMFGTTFSINGANKGTCIITEVNAAFRSGLTDAPDGFYFRKEFILYLADMVSRRPSKSRGFYGARLIDWVEYFRQNESIQFGQAPPRCAQLYDIGFAEATEVMSVFRVQVDEKFEDEVARTSERMRFVVVDDDQYEGTPFKGGGGGGGWSRAPRVRSAINGANGEYTGSDDVEGDDIVVDFAAPAAINPVCSGSLQGPRVIMRQRSEDGWAHPVSAPIFVADKGFYLIFCPPSHMSCSAHTLEMVARTYCYAYSGKVCEHKEGDDCFGRRRVVGDRQLGVNACERLSGTHGEHTGPCDVRKFYRPCDERPCSRPVHYHRLRRPLSGAARRVREAANAARAERKESEPVFLRCRVPGCTDPEHFHRTGLRELRADLDVRSQLDEAKGEQLQQLLRRFATERLWESGDDDAQSSDSDGSDNDAKSERDEKWGPAAPDDYLPDDGEGDPPDSESEDDSDVDRAPYPGNQAEVAVAWARAYYREEQLALHGPALSPPSRIRPEREELVDLQVAGSIFLIASNNIVPLVRRGVDIEEGLMGAMMGVYDVAVEQGLIQAVPRERGGAAMINQLLDAAPNLGEQLVRELRNLPVGEADGFNVDPMDPYDERPMPLVRVDPDAVHALAVAAAAELSDGEEESCILCAEDIGPNHLMVIPSCRHELCDECFIRLWAGNGRCPLCNAHYLENLRWRDAPADVLIELRPAYLALEDGASFGAHIGRVFSMFDNDPATSRMWPGFDEYRAAGGFGANDYVSDVEAADGDPHYSSSDEDSESSDEDDDAVPVDGGAEPEPEAPEPDAIDMIEVVEQAIRANDALYDAAAIAIRRAELPSAGLRSMRPHRGDLDRIGLHEQLEIRHNVTFRIAQSVEAIRTHFHRRPPWFDRERVIIGDDAPPAPPFIVRRIGGFEVRRSTVFYQTGSEPRLSFFSRVGDWLRGVLPLVHASVDYKEGDQPGPLVLADRLAIRSAHGRGWFRGFFGIDHTSSRAFRTRESERLMAILASMFDSYAVVDVYTQLYSDLLLGRAPGLVALSAREVLYNNAGKFELRTSFMAAVRREITQMPGIAGYLEVSREIVENTLHYYVQQRAIEAMRSLLAQPAPRGLAFRQGARSIARPTTAAPFGRAT